MLVAVISALGFALSVLLIVRARRVRARTPEEGADAGRPREERASVPWAAFFSFLQLFVAVYSALGFVEQDLLSALFLNVVLCAGVVFDLERARVADALRAFADRHPRIGRPLVVMVVSVCLAGAFAWLALEVPSNHDLTWAYPLCMLLEWGLITITMGGIYFISQRRGVPCAVEIFVLYVIGLAEYFVITFRSMPITPSDLTALSTAASVSGGYSYDVTAFCLYALGFACLGALLVQVAAFYRFPKEQRTRARMGVNVAWGVFFLAFIVCQTLFLDYYNTLQISVYSWRPLESYYRQGFLPSFISEAQEIIPSKPSGYSVDAAEELIDDYAADYDERSADDEDRAAAVEQFEQDSPTVIVIMNESFSDLSIFDEMHAGYDGPEYFNSISDALLRGTLYVSALGGGTANTEYEFLTGNSMAYLGSGVYPYTTYELSDVENLAQQFSDLGYSTVAMHPNHATNWNRENAYAELGFDEFLDIDDFEDADTLRDMVTDQATYDKILELLEDSDEPQFIFDVTMQNHSGYYTGLIPYSERVTLNIDGTIDAAVNEYVSLIQASDEALEYFLEALEEVDEEVIVVFFGDHQPYMTSDYNDLWYDDEDDAEHTARVWQTDYVIWANYDVAGNDQVSEEQDISVNYLNALLMEVIGAPLSDYQKALLAIQEDLPLVTSVLYADSDMTLYLKGTDVDEDDGQEAVSAADAWVDLWNMQYYQMFYDGKDVFTSNYQDEPNETDPNEDPGTTLIK